MESWCTFQIYPTKSSWACKTSGPPCTPYRPTTQKPNNQRHHRAGRDSAGSRQTGWWRRLGETERHTRRGCSGEPGDRIRLFE
uniref:Uncharacterized protein MANES_01G153800 n=1 Tax=Rhizophora mucronata TaxID=61149 RepID=A0A2P2NHH5_RHIMU